MLVFQHKKSHRYISALDSWGNTAYAIHAQRFDPAKESELRAKHPSLSKYNSVTFPSSKTTDSNANEKPKQA